MKARILEFYKWVVVPKELNNIIAAGALILGFRKEMVYLKKKDTLFWEKVKELLSDVFFDTIDKSDVAGCRTELQQEQKMIFIKKELIDKCGEYDETKAGELSPAFK